MTMKRIGRSAPVPLPKRACLLYHFGKCSAPCERLIEAEAYAKAVKRAAKFLSHPPISVVRQVRDRMLAHAERLKFERAQRIKEQLKVLERALSLQIVERDVKHDRGVIDFAACASGERTAMVMHIQQGAVVELELHRFNEEANDANVLRRFLLARYSNNCSHELIVNCLPDAKDIAAALGAEAGRRASVAQALPVQPRLPGYWILSTKLNTACLPSAASCTSMIRAGLKILSRLLAGSFGKYNCDVRTGLFGACTFT